MIMYMKMGGDQPSGWSYNPSSWAQRWILIVLGFVGWMVSRYLAAHQLGYVDHAWGWVWQRRCGLSAMRHRRLS